VKRKVSWNQICLGRFFARVKAFSTFLQYCIINYKSSQVTANDEFRPQIHTHTHTDACMSTPTRDIFQVGKILYWKHCIDGFSAALWLCLKDKNIPKSKITYIRIAQKIFLTYQFHQLQIGFCGISICSRCNVHAFVIYLKLFLMILKNCSSRSFFQSWKQSWKQD